MAFTSTQLKDIQSILTLWLAVKSASAGKLSSVILIGVQSKSPSKIKLFPEAIYLP